MRQERLTQCLPYLLLPMLLLMVACGGTTAPMANPITSTAARVTVSPNPIDFGNSRSGFRTVVLTNHGAHTLVIASIVSQPSNVFHAGFAAQGLYLLPPSGQLRLPVIFTAPSTGVFAGYVSVAGYPLASPSISAGALKTIGYRQQQLVPIQIAQIPVRGGAQGASTGTNNSGNGQHNQASVSISPSSVSLTSSASYNFHATVAGSASNSIIWSATLGAISPNGTYTAPRVSSTTYDKVSAILASDQTIYDSASVTVTPSTTAPTTPPPTPAGVNNYWVATSGNDSNSGSESSPWATVRRTVDSFTLGTNGTVIHVAAGSYGTSEVDVTRGGSAPGVRLVIQCDPGVTSATAAIGQCRFQGRWIVTGNYVDVVGFDIGNNPNLDIALESACDLRLTGSDVACVTGNSFHALGNYLHDVGANIVNPNTGAIGCPLAGMLQLNNQHYHTMTDQQAIGNIVVRYGSGYPSPGECNNAQGIYPSTSGAIVENNIVGDIPTGGIASSGGCYNVISNNTIFNVMFGIGLGSIRDCNPGEAAGNNTVNNNYVSAAVYSISNGNSSPASDCTSGSPNFFGNNILDSTQGQDWRWAPLSCDVINPGSFAHQTPGVFFQNYKANGTGDYRLGNSSLGINTGTTTCTPGGLSPCTPAEDMYGVIRSAPLSVGAYETTSQ